MSRESTENRLDAVPSAVEPKPAVHPIVIVDLICHYQNYPPTTRPLGEELHGTVGLIEMLSAIPTDDPRLTGDYVRRLPGGDDGDVFLIGVVHDHPASKFRVRSVIETVDPAVLALELPPIAVPLFERYADDPAERESGGEMSSAIRAADTDTVVGIDGPTPAFLGKLIGNIYRSDVTPSTVRTVMSGLVSVTAHAAVCRIEAFLGAPTTVGRAVKSQVTYDYDGGDSPHRQAADERTQIERTKSVMNVFGESVAVRLRDETREAHMTDRLATLRRRGTVVAVVGIDHLDSVAELLRDG